ncbi:MAG: YeeE/YedE family protein [Pseudomonadota bacterium]
MKQLAAFAAGLLFGLGLIVSGMVNPAKVLAFLDVAGEWDPSLAFVMAGAVAVNGIGYRVATGRAHPLFETKFSIPTRTDIDRDLVAGACLFGVGWGLAGFCPGPALAALGAAPAEAAIFVAAMLVGMTATKLVRTRPAVRPDPA